MIIRYYRRRVTTPRAVLKYNICEWFFVIFLQFFSIANHPVRKWWWGEEETYIILWKCIDRLEISRIIIPLTGALLLLVPYRISFFFFFRLLFRNARPYWKKPTKKKPGFDGFSFRFFFSTENCAYWITFTPTGVSLNGFVSQNGTTQLSGDVFFWFLHVNSLTFLVAIFRAVILNWSRNDNPR